MAASATAWSLAQGIHDLGIGFLALFQSGGPVLELRIADMAIGSGEQNSPSAAKLTKKKSEWKQESITAIHQSMKRTLDTQTFIVSLASREIADIYTHLSLLAGPLTDDADAMIHAVDSKDTPRTVREFKTMLGSAALSHQPLVQRFINALDADASSSSSIRCRFSHSAAKDAAKAETQANTLFAWASTFVPKTAASWTRWTKQDKITVMPYVVAMAYAVRIKLDVHYIEGSVVSNAEKSDYLDRSRKTVDEFVPILQMATKAMLDGSSLLEVALDYQLALTTYMTLLTTLQKSVQMTLSPQLPPEDIAPWDDGLSSIRALLCRASHRCEDGAEASAITIPLDTVKESVWWARFSDEKYEERATQSLRTSISLSELLLVMGASQDKNDGDAAATIRLAPDYKRTLTQLPPARLLQSALHTKLAAALDSPSDALDSCARIRNARDLPPSTATLAAPLESRPRLVRTLTGHSGTVRSLALCTDNQRVVSASLDNTAKVWSLGTGQLLHTFTDHSDKVRCVALSPDGKRAVTGGDDKTVRVWSIDSGTQQHSFTGHTSDVYSAAVSPDGRTVASAGRDMTIKLWDIFSGKLETTLVSHHDTVFGVAFSPDGQTLVSGSGDNTIKVWNVNAVHDASLARTLAQRHSNFVESVAFTSDGEHLLSCSRDETVKVWNLRTGGEEMVFSNHTDEVSSVAAFPDGERIVSGSKDKTIRIWNLRNGELEHTLTDHTDWVRSVVISRDGRTMVSGSNDRSIKVWDLS